VLGSNVYISCGNSVQRVLFCDGFLLLQNELDEFSIMWAGHRIRPSRLAPGPLGRPSFMYEVSEAFEGIDCLVTVPAAEREMCMDECSFKEDSPCDKDVYELCRICMNERHWTMPLDAYSAIELYGSSDMRY